MSYRYVLFDFDGTVSDSGQGVMEAAVYAFSRVGIKIDDPMELRSFVGPPLIESFSGFRGLDSERAEYAVGEFRRYYKANCMTKNHMYPGIDGLFKTLRENGRKVVIATSKLQAITEKLLADFGIANLVDFVAGHDETRGRNNKADVIRYALDSLGVTDKSQAVMVGDRKYDIIGANMTGLDSVGVLYGYGDRPELEAAGATYIVQTVEAIASTVLAEKTER